jgi:hypothetical protein
MRALIFTLTISFFTLFNGLSQSNTSTIFFKKGKIVADGKAYSNVNEIKQLFASTENKEVQLLVQKYSSQKKWSNVLGIGGLFLLAGGLKANIDRRGQTTIAEKLISLSGGICLGLGISLNKKSSKTLNTAVELHNFDQKKELGFVSESFIPEVKYIISF